MNPTATFCFRGMFRPHSITTGIMTSTPSVEMFSTACASAMLLRHVLLPMSSGLQGPERMAVKTIVSFYDTSVSAICLLHNIAFGWNCGKPLCWGLILYIHVVTTKAMT